MTTAAITTITASGQSSLVASPAEQHWYAAYTCVRHEKKIEDVLRQRTVEAYLPTYVARHQWQDRKVTLELPLFPGYVFVHISPDDRRCVLMVPGVIRLVGFGGEPMPLPDSDIEGIRSYLARRLPAEPYKSLVRGRRVLVKSGPLQGCEGVVMRRKGSLRLVLTLALINRSVVMEVSAADIEPLPPARTQASH